MQHRLRLLRAQHRQLAQRRFGAALKHLLQHLQQVLAKLLGQPGTEPCPIGFQLQRQVRTQINHQRQRVVGLFVVRHLTKHQAAGGIGLQRFGHRVILEHQDAVEQRFAALPGPALDIEQWRVIVLTQGDVQRLHGVQPVTQRLLRAGAGNDRQGIDEQADLLLDALEFGRPPSRGRTKGDAGLAGIALQHQQPGRLHHGIDGDPALTGKGVQAGGLPGIQLLYPLDLPLPFTTGCPVRGPGQQCGCIQILQLAGPERLAGCAILALQPGNVVTEAPRPLLRHAAVVPLQHLPQQPGIAPAIHQDVVAGVDQVITLRVEANQGQAQQRRLAQVEAGRAVCSSERLQRIGKVVTATPVMHRERQLRLALNDLQRAGQLTPDEAATQQVMAVDCRLPGSTEALGIHASHIDPQLVDVIPALLQQRMEHHALLHG
ncbi:hypothetical protein D3C80_778520 [compost metagenome]